MRVAFRKMHGIGNDFVVLDLRAGGKAPTAALARALADRHRGVGFDQLVTLSPAEAGSGADARVGFLNADGTPSGACGNGARCAALLLMEESGRDSVAMRTEAGLLPARRSADGRITVDMGPPRLGWRDVPLAFEADVEAPPLSTPHPATAVSVLSMGNPHCVLFAPDAEAAPLETLGPALERDPLFPERANVEFVHVIDRGAVRARVWERGAGVTLACGSGACAVGVAAMRRGLVDRRVDVRLDGGTLTIEWPEAPGAGVLMTGPAATVFEGALSAEFLAGVEAA